MSTLLTLFESIKNSANQSQQQSKSGFLNSIVGGVQSWWNGQPTIDFDIEGKFGSLIDKFKTGKMTIDQVKESLDNMGTTLSPSQFQDTVHYFEDLDKNGKQADATIQGLTGSLHKMSGKEIFGGIAAGFKSVMKSLAISATVTIAIAAITKLTDFVINYKNNLIKAGAEAANTWKESNASLEGQIKTYEKLKKELASGTLSSAEEYEVSAQILDIQNQITTQYGEQASGVSLVNGNLTEQLNILRQIAAEEAKKSLIENEKEYNAIREEMTQTRNYSLGSSLILDDMSDQAYSELYNFLSVEDNINLDKDFNGVVKFSFTGDATEAQEALTNVSLKIDEMQDKYSNDEATVEALTRLKRVASDQLAINKKITDSNAEAYNSILQQEMLAAGVGEGSVYDIYNKYAEAVTNYNHALSSGDVKEISNAEYEFNNISQAVQDILQMDDNAQFAGMFEDITNTLDTASIKAYDFKEVINSIIGDKKLRKNNQFNDVVDNITNASTEIKKLDLNATDVIRAFDQTRNIQFDGKDEIIALGKIWGLTSDAAVSDIKDFANALTNLGIVSSSSENALQIANGALADYKSQVVSVKEAVEVLKTALSESVSGTGITSDSLKSLRDLYGDDVAGILEETANGYHLNAKGLRELNKMQEESTKSKYLSSLAEQQKQLRVIEEEIAEQFALGNDVSGLISSRNGILDNISALEELQRQYEASTSAYAKFQEALSGQKERDMYEQIVGQKEAVEELIKDGWRNDPLVRTYTDLLSSKDLSTAPVEDVMAEWERLNSHTYDTGHTIFDFFTQDDSGVTSEGVYNFFDTVKAEQQKVGKEWVKITEDGKYMFDFGEGRDKEVADFLGMDVESLQAILRAATDDAFIVNLDQPIASIEELKTNAQLAQTALSEMGDSGFNKINLEATSHDGILESIESVQNYIDEVNTSDLDIEAKTDRLEYANDILEYLVEKLEQAEYEGLEIPVDSTQLDMMLNNAKSTLDQFKNNGVIDITLEGAEEAINNYKTLLQLKLRCERPSFMNIDVSSLEGDAYTALNSLQELELAIENLNYLKQQQSDGIPIDTTEIQNAEQHVQNLAQGILNLPEEVKVAGGIDDESFMLEIGRLAEQSPPVEADVEVDPSQVQAKLDELSPSITAKLTPPGTTEEGNTTTVTAVVVGQEDVQKLIDIIDSVKDKNADVTAEVDMNDYWNVVNLTSQLDKVKSKDITINVTVTGDSLDGIVGVNGSAHVNGTAFSSGSAISHFSGSAFAKGNWGLKHNTSVALMGELGTEILVRNGRWMTIGENGAEFVGGLRKGDIIFNHKQSEELLKNGHVTSDGGRGKAFASGTAINHYYGAAFSNGTTGLRNPWEDLLSSNPSYGSSGSGSSGGNFGGSSGNSGSDSEAEKLDWIERKIKDIERDIENLDQTAQATYKSWSTRNEALVAEMSKVTEEIDIQKKAYDRYMQEAYSVGLSDEYANKVMDGTIDIESIGDEDLRNKISEFQEWYDKAVDCADAVQDLEDNLAELAQQKFDNVMQQFDDLVSTIEHSIEMIEGGIDQLETAGYLISKQAYEDLKTQQKEHLSTEEKRLAALKIELENAMKSGDIVEGSEAWYEMKQDIYDTESAIQELNTALIETDNNIRQLEWERFKLAQGRKDRITAESEFLLGLMENEDRFNKDNGRITNYGRASQGLHAVNYNTEMNKVDAYTEMIKDLEDQLAQPENLGNQILQEKLDEYVDARYEAVEAAEAEKDAILEIVREGYDNLLDIMDKAISKKTELLQLEKEQADYEKTIADKAKEVMNLERQLQAYSTDTSEEGIAAAQKIKVQLEEAKYDLESTEMDRYIQETEQLLTTLQDDTSEWIDNRMDQEAELLRGVITSTNQNAQTIKETLETEANGVGVKLSDQMAAIWTTGGVAQTVVAEYGVNFGTQLTTTNQVLASIEELVREWSKIGADKYDESKKEPEKPADTPTPPATPITPPQESDDQKEKDDSSSITVGSKINAGSARIYANSKGTGGGKQYFANDPIYTVIGEENGYVRVRWHKASSGSTGWFKKSDVKAYSTGGLIDYDGLAQVHGGKKPELVLNAKDTENFIALKDVLQRIDSQDLMLRQEELFSLQDAMRDMAAYSKEQFRNMTMDIPRPSRSTDQNISIQIGDIQMYGVNDPETFATQLKETLKNNVAVKKIIQADTLGVMTGKNTLTKLKYV